jgi:hypothetical protein
VADDSSITVRIDARTEDFDAGLDRAKDSAQSFIAGIKDIISPLGQMGDSASDAGKKLSAALSDHDAARIAADNAREQMQAANLAYQSEMEKLKMSLAFHETTEAEKTAVTIAEINKRLEAQQAALVKEAADAQGNVVKLAHIENEKKLAALRAANEIEKAQDQATLKSVQEWKSAADQIAGAFDSQLRKLLSGTEKWSQAMKNIAADLVIKLIENQVKATAEFLAEKAREVAFTIAGENAKTTATTAGAALRSGAEVLSGQTSILAVISDAMTSIYASGGKAGAAVAAEVAPESGPAAPAIGAAAGASVVATGLGLVSGGGKFDLGTDYVLRGGLAMIHQGETIVPAIARGTGPYAGRGSGMGSTVHAPVSVNISALDSRSIERFFNDNAKHMIRAINNGVKNGAHLALRGART